MADVEIEVILPLPIELEITEGAPGPRGAPGIGIPSGGTPGQIIIKGEGDTTFWSTPTKTIDKKPVSLGITGNVTAQTPNSITDNTKAWIVDEFKDKAVKLDTGVVAEYAIVLSNTEDTLVFDDVLLNPAASYSIIDSLVVNPSDLDCIIALDIIDACCAVILPLSTVSIERGYVHAYIERAVNGLYKAPIMCRGTQRQAGQKYGTLEHQGEGVRLHAHMWGVPHWDIIQTYNITRLASAYWTVPQTVNSSSWAPVLGMIADKAKRFTLDSGWFRYLSLLPRMLKVTFTANITKSGGVGDMDISIAKRDAAGVITFLDYIQSSSRFGSGVGNTTITVDLLVELTYRESLVAIAQRSGGTFQIDPGSNLIIEEL